MFGLEKIGEQSVAEARATVAETIQKIDPLITHVLNGFGWMIHSVLNRFVIDCSFTFKINPMTKADYENPPPNG